MNRNFQQKFFKLSVALLWCEVCLANINFFFFSSTWQTNAVFNSFVNIYKLSGISRNCIVVGRFRIKMLHVDEPKFFSIIFKRPHFISIATSKSLDLNLKEHTWNMMHRIKSNINSDSAQGVNEPLYHNHGNVKMHFIFTFSLQIIFVSMKWINKYPFIWNDVLFSLLGDHALLEGSQLLILNKKCITVRSKSVDGLSSDSQVCVIPNELLRGIQKVIVNYFSPLLSLIIL